MVIAGKKTYTVKFDLNGGTLISGELEQTVAQGKNATPPTVAKDGCYLHSWSTSYKQVTRDIVVKAVWEWQTSTGFNYTSAEDSDYCEIVSSFEDLTGDVYVGVYHNNKRVLGIKANAFNNRDGITKIHMLDGILSIGEKAFSDCDSLISVELPNTLTKLGMGAFENCVSLEKVVIPPNLTVIPEKAFAGCTSLKEIVIPATVKTISAGAFDGCTSLEKITFETKDIVEKNEQTGEKEVVGTNGVVIIEGGAFRDCTALTEVVLPKTVEVIGEYAFEGEQLTVYTVVEEENKPDGWVDNWCESTVKIEWESTEPEDADDSSDDGNEAQGRKR